MCPRGRTSCVALSNIVSDNKESFFCCGENSGETRTVEQDKYTVCFKGEFRDEESDNDKRDLIHGAAVIMQALAVVEKAAGDDKDWSAWKDLQPVARRMGVTHRKNS